MRIHETWDLPMSKTTTYIEQNGLLQKWCPRCGVYKSADDEFYTYQGESGHIEHRSWCMHCEENARLLRTYGINLETREHWELLQEHRCWICEEQCPLDLDHAHNETKNNRALLCPSCNKGLGNAQDDTKLMLRAAKYLESYILPFLARFLPFKDETGEVDQGGEGDPGLLV